MRYGSPTLREVLKEGSFDARYSADIFYDGQRALQDVDVTDVKFDEDGTSKVQQGGSLTIIWQDPFGGGIAPEEVDDILSPFGTTMRLYQIVTDGPLFIERVPLGLFVVSDSPLIQTNPWDWKGHARTKGDKVKVTFKDPFYKVQRNRFDVPGVTPTLTSVYAEIQRLSGLQVTRNAAVPDGPIPRALVYEEERLDALYELGQVLDAVPYMTNDGTASLRPNAWGSAVDTIQAANAAGPGGRGTLVSVARGMSAEGVYNRVVFRAQGQQPGVLAAAEIADGPLRARNGDGSDSPFGRVPYFMSSQFVTTQAQASEIVNDWLPRVSRPQAVVMVIEEIINPLREVGDVVNVRRKGKDLLARVVSVKRTMLRTQTTTVVVGNAG